MQYYDPTHAIDEPAPSINPSNFFHRVHCPIYYEVQNRVLSFDISCAKFTSYWRPVDLIYYELTCTVLKNINRNHNLYNRHSVFVVNNKLSNWKVVEQLINQISERIETYDELLRGNGLTDLDSVYSEITSIGRTLKTIYCKSPIYYVIISNLAIKYCHVLHRCQDVSEYCCHLTRLLRKFYRIEYAPDDLILENYNNRIMSNSLYNWMKLTMDYRDLEELKSTIHWMEQKFAQFEEIAIPIEYYICGQYIMYLRSFIPVICMFHRLILVKKESNTVKSRFDFNAEINRDIDGSQFTSDIFHVNYKKVKKAIEAL